MIQPIVQVSQFAHIYPSIQPGAGKPTIVYYKHNGVDFHSAIKLFRTLDEDRMIVCPACGAPVRQLAHWADRPGLGCIACVSLHKYKADELPERKPKAAKSKPVTKSRGKNVTGNKKMQPKKKAA